MVKHGEITSPLITAILAKRIATHRKTVMLFGAAARPLELNDREWQIVEQSLRLATKMMEAHKPC